MQARLAPVEPAISLSAADRPRVEKVRAPRLDQARADYILHRLYAIGDLLAVMLAAIVAAGVSFFGGREFGVSEFGLALALMVPFWFLIAYCAGLYTDFGRQIDQSYVDHVGKIAMVATIWCWGFVLVRSVFVVGVTDLFTPALLWVLMTLLLLLSRSLIRGYARRRAWNVRAVAALGDPEGVAALSQRIDRHPEWGLDVQVDVAMQDGRFLTRDSHPPGDGSSVWTHSADPGRYAESGSEEQQLAALLGQLEIDRVLIAGGTQDLVSRTELIRELIDRGITVDHISGGPENLYSSAHLQHLEGLTVMTVSATGRRPFAMFLKRALDVAVASFGLIVSSPMLALSTLAIRIDSRGPILFRQDREGREGETFRVLKLRTMVDGADEDREAFRGEGMHGDGPAMLKLKDDPRVTRIGKLLRNWSVDELPQLWNVIRGDMSLVGPRPLPLDEASHIDPDFSARQRVRPGITGPWQIMGRSDIPMQDMVKLDYTYVVGWSLAEDMRILLKTISAVAGRKGVY